MSDSILSKLTAQWYNAFSASIGQSIDSFQITQPSTPILGEKELKLYFNNLPKATLTSEPSGGAQFYDRYSALLSQLATITPTLEEKVGGPCAAAFMKYMYSEFLKDNPKQPIPIPANVLAANFQRWAYTHDFPSEASAGYQALMNISLDPIASTKLVNSRNIETDKLNWGLNFDDLTAALNKAPNRVVNLDSSSESSDISRTWAKGKINVRKGIFSGEATAETEQITKKFASSKVTIAGKIDHITQFLCQPGTWYNSAALGLAYNNKTGSPWVEHPAQPWDKWFGDGGMLQRFAVNLIVATGVDFTITSDANFSSSEMTKIQAKVKVGVWPFFSATVEGGRVTNTATQSGGKLQLHFSSNKSTPILLGVNVQDTGKYVGAEVIKRAIIQQKAVEMMELV